MKYRGYRVDLVVTLALLTLLVLVGGQAAYGRVFVERPLLEELRSIPGVMTVSIEKVAANYNITMDLAAGSNFPTLYRQATEVAQQALGSSRFNLQIIDNRTTTLENLYRQMQIHIEEAVAQGNFSVAAKKINEIAEQARVQASFYVDEERVYLELHQNDAYLYAVRHRIFPQKGVATI